jgi:hypothetical protein
VISLRIGHQRVCCLCLSATGRWDGHDAPIIGR